jgi:hypothetical protein
MRRGNEPARSTTLRLPFAPLLIIWSITFGIILTVCAPIIRLNCDNKNMNSNHRFLQNLYDAFNKREIETIIALMRPDVKWANGLEGGFVHGRGARILD